MRTTSRRVALRLLVILIAVGLIAVAARFSLPGGTLRYHFARQTAAKPRKPARPPVPVFAATSAARNEPIVIRGLGTVQAYNTATIKSQVDGIITKVDFQEGQYVRAGQELMQIDPRPYRAKVEQIEATKAKDDAALTDAEANLARYSALLPQGLAVTRQQYETQKATVAQDAATVKADQAQIDAAKLSLGYATITSPINGITGIRQVDIGNYITASSGTPLVVITQIRPAFVVFSVPEHEIGMIRAAMAQRKLQVLAFNGEDTQQIAAGTLEVINNQVSQTTGTVSVKAVFPNKNTELWPGQFVNAHLVLRTVENGITVPAAAVLMGPSGAYVYLIRPDDTVEPRPVAVTQVENGSALIGKGLALGDRVITSGQEGLAPGAKVAVAPGQPGELIAKEPQVGPEGVGSTGITTAPAGAGGSVAR